MDIKAAQQENEGFCTLCGLIIKSFEGLSNCPACKTESIPCGFENQLNITINQQELRILVIWAERWVGEMKDEPMQHNSARILRAILHRINEQLPDNHKVQMLSQEINDLKKMDNVSDVQTNLLDLSGEKDNEF